VVLAFYAFTQGAKDAQNGTNSFAAELYKGFKGIFEAVKLL
jgi:hypothetical protein